MPPSTKTIFSVLQLFVFSLLLPCVKTTYSNYPNSDSVPTNIKFQGDATTAGGIQLTTNQRDEPVTDSVGRALYAEPVRLWESSTGRVADFTTRFSFSITVDNDESAGADGLAFFLVPDASSFPSDSGGGCLGLFNDLAKSNSLENPVVAIEFDTFTNEEWDPVGDHVGIDINSVASRATFSVPAGFTNSISDVSVFYNSSTKNLSVNFTNAGYNGYAILSYIIDLKHVLPEWVNVGFSASTGLEFEYHKIISWEFNSTEFTHDKSHSTGFPSYPAPAPDGGNNGSQSPSGPGAGGGNDGTQPGSGPGTGGGKNDKKSSRLIISLIVGGTLLIVGFGVVMILIVLRRKSDEMKDEEAILEISCTEDDYDKGTGPKRFSYGELVCATNNFTVEGKLGEGGFGSVYKGVLGDPNIDIAVKRVSRGSRQGKKEFVSEVKIISQLRHRNLVKLLGWCHDRGEFLLVYEFMPNGSLDFHLFGARTILPWVLRNKIALGLASALLYLHEEWEPQQCVVHRDIKSSNIMLDSCFNAKLGDFGLARFVKHGLGVKTTLLAGTVGYMAPECIISGRSGKESDVFSFGVVALEIASGRRVVESTAEESKIALVAWVWGLYRSGRLLEAVDSRLFMDFDEQQMNQLMVVGLWCASSDHNLRPSIKQAISVLNFEAPLPDLFFNMYDASRSSVSETQGDHSYSYVSCLSHNRNPSHTSSSASLLYSASSER